MPDPCKRCEHRAQASPIVEAGLQVCGPCFEELATEVLGSDLQELSRAANTVAFRASELPQNRAGGWEARVRAAPAYLEVALEGLNRTFAGEAMRAINKVLPHLQVQRGSPNDT